MGEKMKRLFIVFVITLLAMGIGSVNAGDAEAGKAKSASCAGCHGQDGISANPVWPNLAGQHEPYLIMEMKEYRDEVRNDPLMTPIVHNLTDEDIEDLAAYYASLSCGS